MGKLGINFVITVDNLQSWLTENWPERVPPGGSWGKRVGYRTEYVIVDPLALVYGSEYPELAGGFACLNEEADWEWDMFGPYTTRFVNREEALQTIKDSFSNLADRLLIGEVYEEPPVRVIQLHEDGTRDERYESQRGR